MHTQIHPSRGFEEVLNLLVGFCAPELLPHIEEDEFGHAETCGTGHLAADKLGHESLGAVACTAELQHIPETVVSIGHSGERPAFAKRGNVTCDHLLS